MTLDEMKDYMRGKDIILVGNGLDALEYMMGDFIDGKDLTIRFGRGVPEPVIFDRIGTNTHIWVTGQLRMDAHPEVPTRAKVLLTSLGSILSTVLRIMITLVCTMMTLL